MSDARALVDHQLAWMNGHHRPSPQRGDEEDGAEATFLVDGTMVVVYASNEGEVEIYAMQPNSDMLWSFKLQEDEELPAEDQTLVLATLDEMGKHVRFPAEAWRTAWTNLAPPQATE